MITITAIGLDEYVIGHYAKDHSDNLANLYETSVDNINFVASNSFLIHKGVEQTSWNALIKVSAPKRFEVFQDKIATYLLETLTDFTINIAIEFSYYENKNRYVQTNDEYPLFLSEQNLVQAEESSLEEGEELFEGNIFENFEEKVKARAEIHKHEHDDEDECHCEECDCDDDCDCEEGECHCGHHH